MVKCDFDIGWTESFVVVYGCTDYPFVDFKKNLKIRKEKGPQFYKMATILTNCHTCLHGSQVNYYFEGDPPGSDEYLN